MRATTDIDEGLRSSSWTGFTGFPIKAKDTKKNQMIHDAFRQFCKEQTDDDYTRGLEYLIEYWQGDMKYELMWQEINQLKVELANLKKVPTKEEVKEDENEGMF